MPKTRAGIDYATVKDIVLFPFEFDRLKHDLGDESWTEAKLNHMTRMELLEAISAAFEERIAPIERAARHLVEAAKQKGTA